MTFIDNTRAAYRVLDVNGFYGPDDHLYQLDEEIYFDGEPNEELEPLNEPARQRMIAYVDKLDQLGREAAQKAGKAYAARPRTLDGAIELATAIARNTMPIMGAKKEEPAIQRIGVEEVPEVGSINPKRGRGRPPGSVKKTGALKISEAHSQTV